MLKTCVSLAPVAQEYYLSANSGPGIAIKAFTNAQPPHSERVRVDYSLTEIFAGLVYKRNLHELIRNDSN